VAIIGGAVIGLLIGGVPRTPSDLMAERLALPLLVAGALLILSSRSPLEVVAALLVAAYTSRCMPSCSPWACDRVPRSCSSPSSPRTPPGMVPFTPGGLEFVEAGPSGTLVLTGAPEDQEGRCRRDLPPCLVLSAGSGRRRGLRLVARRSATMAPVSGRARLSLGSRVVSAEPVPGLTVTARTA
jgi:hypothetical protein